MNLLQFAQPLTLKTRLMIVFTIVVIFQALITGFFTHRYIEYIMEERIGAQALQLSKVVSNLPAIQEGLRNQNANQVQQLAELIRHQTDARFIVVGDTDGIRFSHPIPERIGQKRVGDDNQRAIENAESYVSKAVGSLGPSMRGKSPIFNNQGDVIGVTSVGYMLDTVDQTVRQYQQSALIVAIASLLISIIISIVVTKHFKRVLFGYEPEEIASLFEERNTTLQTIREGVIAIDAEGKITTFNRTAIQALGLEDEDLSGRSMKEISPHSDLWRILDTGKKMLDHETIINGKAYIVNRLPIKVDDKITGAVSSFRPKDDIEQLSNRLHDIEQYTETLRSQSHDYANKLHTIAGLIQIGSFDQALEFIGQESRGIQELVQQLVEAIPDPILAGCILGKYNRANELGLELVFNRDSHMQKKPVSATSEKLVIILGNIIDNAFDTTRRKLAQNDDSNNKIILTISDYGNDLIFDIEDHGVGISEEERYRIFQKGISTKNEIGHGYGLYLVKKTVSELYGQIAIEPTDHGGSRFLVYLPKKQRNKN